MNEQTVYSVSLKMSKEVRVVWCKHNSPLGVLSLFESRNKADVFNYCFSNVIRIVCFAAHLIILVCTKISGKDGNLEYENLEPQKV